MPLASDALPPPVQAVLGGRGDFPPPPFPRSDALTDSAPPIPVVRPEAQTGVFWNSVTFCVACHFFLVGP